MKEVSYKRYLLVLLLVIYIFNYVDRGVLSLVLQDIKVDLDLSDTQLGLLTGIAFALFYSIMGVPIARWADRGNRVTIITVTTALWSVMVALSGFAVSFVQLLLIRIGVSVGEAGCLPPAHSLIADYFSRAERPRAMAIYMSGASLSTVIGFVVGGWLNELYGWRATFIILGLPGIGLALLARLTLREPRLTRQTGETGPVSRPRVSSVPQVFITLWRNVTFRHLLFAFAVSFFFSAGIGQWMPSFFIRSHGMQTAELGIWLASIFGVGGTFGVYMGGALASRYAANNEPLQLRAMGIMYTLYAIVAVFIYLSMNKYVALGLLGLSAIVGSITYGPMFAIIQTLVHERMRAMSIALLYLFSNLLGAGLGPLAVGVLSDVFVPSFGEQSLRYALVAFCPGYLWMATHFWLASKTVNADLVEVQAGNCTAIASGLNRLPQADSPAC